MGVGRGLEFVSYYPTRWFRAPVRYSGFFVSSLQSLFICVYLVCSCLSVRLSFSVSLIRSCNFLYRSFSTSVLIDFPVSILPSL